MTQHYVLYKKPIQLETLNIVQYLHYKNISFLPNVIIEKNYPIKTGFTDIQNQRRFWEIEGFSKVACGGTHVKKTSEVGYIALKRINVGAGKERIEIKLIENNLGLN